MSYRGFSKVLSNEPKFTTDGTVSRYSGIYMDYRDFRGLKAVFAELEEV